tara:strand:+ start:188 stop:340 length:153 start_codon:yes stop_codon:yes gene_type:complete
MGEAGILLPLTEIFGISQILDKNGKTYATKQQVAVFYGNVKIRVMRKIIL